MSKDTLYIDIDDTLIVRASMGTRYDLRPGVMTQLHILASLFDCQWLTCWKFKNDRHLDICTLLGLLYATDLIDRIDYCDWTTNSQYSKSAAVLSPDAPTDFWWLENPLYTSDIKALEEAGKLDRYVEVEPHGPWGFADACLELFRRAKVSEKDIHEVKGSLRMFRKEDFFPIV